MKFISKSLVLVALAFSAAFANAGPINAPVPTNLYISDWNNTGLDVAWAGPCAPLAPSCGVIDLTYQSQFGWRLATLPEISLLSSLTVNDFRVNNGQIACASPYFNVRWSHCDPGNRFVFGQPGDLSWGEAVVVRGGASQVSEPSSIALLGVALAAFGWRRRQQKA